MLEVPATHYQKLQILTCYWEQIGTLAGSFWSTWGIWILKNVYPLCMTKFSSYSLIIISIEIRILNGALYHTDID